jgi:AcrR family transcriptional regulator
VAPRRASGSRTGKRLDRRVRSARAERRDARQELLSAAADVFAARGFHDASIDEVAKRAGYSKGAVYWHFEGKDDLFLALIEDRVDRPMREMIELLRAAPASQDMVPEVGRRFAEMLAEQREWLLLDGEYWLHAVRDPDLRRRYAEHQRELRMALGAALVERMETLGAGKIAGDPERVAAAIMALNVGLAQQALVDPRAVPEDLFGETIELIYKGLLARGDGSGAAAGPPA